MNYRQMRNTLEKMANENYEDFIKALISVEKGFNDKDALDKLYTDYMENNSMTLLNDEFDYMIDELRENGQLKDNATIQEEDNNLVNVVGNIVGDVEVVERENKNGEPFKVANFSIVSNDENGDKFYTNCSVYGEKISKYIKCFESSYSTSTYVYDDIKDNIEDLIEYGINHKPSTW